MHYFRLLLVIVFCVSYSRTLVYPIKMKKGKNGCLSDLGNELKVGQFVQEPDICGVKRCEGKDGKGLAMYCHIVVPFALCRDPEYVDHDTPFPRCCWTCVLLKDCYDD